MADHPMCNAIILKYYTQQRPLGSHRHWFWHAGHECCMSSIWRGATFDSLLCRRSARLRILCLGVNYCIKHVRHYLGLRVTNDESLTISGDLCICLSPLEVLGGLWGLLDKVDLINPQGRETKRPEPFVSFCFWGIAIYWLCRVCRMTNVTNPRDTFNFIGRKRFMSTSNGQKNSNM